MTQTKKAILTLSKRFMKDHPRAGEPTGFREKVLSGEKIHTCRLHTSKGWWEGIIQNLRRQGGELHLRQWTGKPYASPQETLKILPSAAVHTQLLTLSVRHIPERGAIAYGASVEGRQVPLELLAKNDGLTFQDYIDWFRPLLDRVTDPKTGCGEVTLTIIHFTEFSY